MTILPTMRVELEVDETVSHIGAGGRRWITSVPTGRMRYKVGWVWLPWVARDSTVERALRHVYRALARADWARWRAG